MNFFHVGIGFQGPTVSTDVVQNAIGSEPGWARYAPNCWVVASRVETAQTIATRIRNVLAEADTVFVVSIDVNNSFGYLHKQVWDWIKQQADA